MTQLCLQWLHLDETGIEYLCSKKTLSIKSLDLGIFCCIKGTTILEMRD